MRPSTSALRAQILHLAVVGVVAVAAMAPGLGGELLNWDDNRFVADNPIVHGLSWHNLAAIFGQVHQEAYHPLHLLSYCIDHALFGLWAPGYKLHNLLLYLICLVLLHRLLLRLGLDAGAALAGTLLFAVHPLHVEAVVWVSARKETLSLALALGAALLYLGSASWRQPRRYLAALLFAAALLTKTSTVVLPLLLFAVEVLVLDKRPKKSLLQLAPLLAIAVGVGLFVVGLWQENEMIRPRPGGAGGTVALVLKSLGHHTGKLLLPVSLSPVYPIDRSGAFDAGAMMGALVLAALGLGLWRTGSQPRLRLALVWWLLAALPVLNIVPVYFFVQDRYAFVPSVALAIAGAALFGRWYPAARRAAPLALGLVVVLLGLLSALQARVWRTSSSLWQHAARTQPASYYAHLALGHTQRQAGDLAGATRSYREAVRLVPRLPAARIALCLVEAQRLAVRRGLDGKQQAGRIEAALRQTWLAPEGLVLLAGRLLQARQLGCALLAESRAFELRRPGPAERIAAASRWTLAGHAPVALRRLDGLDGDALPPALRAAYHEVRAQALLLAGQERDARQAFARSLELAPRGAAKLREAARRLEQHGRRKLARFYEAQAARLER